jgi:hypothetical protein
MVPTTAERFAGSATNGVAQSRASAHSYRWPDDAWLRFTHQSSPPDPFIQRSWSANSSRVATAGVL